MGPSSNSRYSRYLRYRFSAVDGGRALVPAGQPEGLARCPRARWYRMNDA